MKYLSDTNVVIDYANDLLSDNAVKAVETNPAISFIIRIELFAWPQLSLADEMVYINFVAACTIYSCEETIILQTIAVRKKYRLKLPDAFIAATALVYNLTLLSRNLKDFRNIKNLTVVDPHTL